MAPKSSTTPSRCSAHWLPMTEPISPDPIAPDPIAPEPISLPKVVVVTGTSTGVGKTMVTAALAVMLRRRGVEVAVVKPLQTGVTADEDGDLQVVRHLVGDDPGVGFHEFVRLDAPLAPDTAARL